MKKSLEQQAFVIKKKASLNDMGVMMEMMEIDRLVRK
jgi:hypothetical protein